MDILQVFSILLFLLSQLGILALGKDILHPIYNSKYGELKGTRRTVDVEIPDAITNTVDEILGIPYAAPPVGNLRFKQPKKPSSWNGIRNATKFGNNCFSIDQNGSEDCLFLNIYIPYVDNSTTDVYPVMVFIHGGSYTMGNGSKYNGSAICQKGVILVTLNYRLGILGFLSTDDESIKGNYGLFDQIKALEWIHENGKYFKFNLSSITIFGNSAGAASVGLLYLSDKTQDLFHKAIIQSGPPTAMWAMHKGREYAFSKEKLLIAFNCDNDLTECLQKLPLNEFNNLCMMQITENECQKTIELWFKPGIDDELFYDDVDKMIERNSYQKKPLMIGSVRNEMQTDVWDNFAHEVDLFVKRNFVEGSSLYRAILYEYVNWDTYASNVNEFENNLTHNYNKGELLSDCGINAPTIDFISKLASHDEESIYVYLLNEADSWHSIELNYIFGTPYIGGIVDETEKSLPMSSENRNLSNFYMTIWTNFAKNGSPNWPAYDLRKSQYMAMRENEMKIKSHPSSKLATFWNYRIKQMMKDDRALSNTANGGLMSHYIYLFIATIIFIL